MVTIINKNTSVEEVRKKLGGAADKSQKQFDAFRFCGKVKFNQNRQVIQKSLRNEWEK